MMYVYPELLERVAEGSVEYQHEIMYVLERNCKDRESMNRMPITGAYLVRNCRLLDQVCFCISVFSLIKVLSLSAY